MTTTHNLIFESKPWERDPSMQKFRIGTCGGLWGSNDFCYYILAIDNEQPGNGHLDDVFEYFEASCIRDDRNLLVLQCMNKSFYDHLINKRGFVAVDEENVIKVFNKKTYRKFKKKKFNPDSINSL